MVLYATIVMYLGLLYLGLSAIGWGLRAIRDMRRLGEGHSEEES